MSMLCKIGLHKWDTDLEDKNTDYQCTTCGHWWEVKRMCVRWGCGKRQVVEHYMDKKCEWRDLLEDEEWWWRKREGRG